MPKRFCKKGISPLIATVLLVAFSVALGAIIMNFSQNSTYELTEQADKALDRGITCSLGLTVKVLDMDNQEFACYNRSQSRNFEIIVENQGDTVLKGMQIFLLDYNNVPYQKNLFVELGAHDWAKYNLSLDTAETGFDFAFPPIKALVSPILSGKGDSVQICTDNRIDLEEFCQCGTAGCV